MRKLLILIAALFTIYSIPIQAQKRSSEGKLFIIGGGERSDALIKKLVETAGLATNDYIIVLPMASVQPDTGFYYISRQIGKHTPALIRNFDFRQPEIPLQQWADSVAGAKLIYILGGDQNSFMKSVLNTPVYDAIHKAYKNGATIAGTSAGAAVMSRYMITGQQLKDSVYKETFNKLLTDNIEFAEGLGLLQQTIIDQHFIRRSRYNRILSALSSRPGFMGIGIDEGTAIIVSGNKARVAGDSQVLRFKHSGRAGRSAGELVNLKNIRLDIYVEGEVFKLKR